MPEGTKTPLHIKLLAVNLVRGIVINWHLRFLLKTFLCQGMNHFICIVSFPEFVSMRECVHAPVFQLSYITF